MPPPPRRPHPFLDAAVGKNPSSSGTKTTKTSSGGRRPHSTGSGSGGVSTPVSDPPAATAKVSAPRRKIAPSVTPPAHDTNAGTCACVLACRAVFSHYTSSYSFKFHA
jgi:hypothetical protein